MKKIGWFLCFWMMTISGVSAQTLDARVNRTEVPEGETLLLTVELNDVKSSDTPDFEVLKSDFTVYSISNAYRTHIINGDMKQSQQWNLVIMPNQKGQITIPSIKLGSLATKPIMIKVGLEDGLQNKSTSMNNITKFKIDGKIDNNQPYVQQQINYTLTIYDIGGLQGDVPVFLTKNTDDWIIKSLGEPEITSKDIDGKNYRLIEFKYALFAQRSGDLEIPAVRFNGYYLAKEQRIDPFQGLFEDDLLIRGLAMQDVFAARNPVQLTTQPIKVKVLSAKEENAKNWWLPAEDVNLYAEFEPKNPQFKVGEAVSRNIYLRAVGVIDSQLPELVFNQVEGVKQYPEKPITSMSINGDKIVSIAETTNVYIPNQGGDLELPEIKVKWYNVNTKKMETAILPPVKVTVIGGDKQETLLSQQIARIDDNPKTTEKNNSEVRETFVKESSLMFVWAFVSGMLLCLVLVKLVNLLKKMNMAETKAKAIIKSAKNKNLRLLRDSILAWAEAKWPEDKFLSLQDVDLKIDDKEFRCELDKLSEALYAKDSSEWNEALFMRVFHKINKKMKSKRKYDEPLPKLYK